MAEHKLTVQYDAYGAERQRADRLEAEIDAALEEARELREALEKIYRLLTNKTLKRGSTAQWTWQAKEVARSALASGEPRERPRT